MLTGGRYYVGDLCYVMDDEEWKEVCSLTIKREHFIDGEFTLKDGRTFAVYSTRYGDGTYRDQLGREYSVDSGTIGCIKFDDIKADKYEDIERLGNVIEFENDITTSGGRFNPEWDGVICIGGVKIKTSGADEFTFET